MTFVQTTEIWFWFVTMERRHMNYRRLLAQLELEMEVSLQASGLQCRDSSQSSLSVLFWTELQCKTMKLLSWSSTETEIFIRQWKLYSSLINVKYEREQYANEECSNSECSNAMISCYTLHVETFPFPLCENIIFSKGKYNSIVVVCTMCGS